MIIPVLFVFIIGYNTQLPCKLSTSFVSHLFYFCGYLYSKKQDKINFNRYLLIIALVLLITLASFVIINYIIILVYNLPLDRINDYPTIKGYSIWWILYSIIGVMIPLFINSFGNRFKSFLHQ